MGQKFDQLLDQQTDRFLGAKLESNLRYRCELRFGTWRSYTQRRWELPCARHSAPDSSYRLAPRSDVSNFFLRAALIPTHVRQVALGTILDFATRTKLALVLLHIAQHHYLPLVNEIH